MANPQIENGHIDLANEIGDVLSMTYFSPAESKIFWAILRKTYGWHKKTDFISYSQFEETTGLHPRHVGPALKRLISRNIIFCSNSGPKKVREYGLQKDYDKWILTPKSVIESNTDLSNKLTPKSVIDNKINLTPITVPSDTDYSKNNPKSDTDLSKHKSNILQNQTTKAILVEIPSWINIETFNDFLEMRKKIKKPMTEKAQHLLILRLEELRTLGNEPNKVLEQSILASWQGVFELKNNESKKGGQNGTNKKYNRESSEHLTTPEEFYADSTATN